VEVNRRVEETMSTGSANAKADIRRVLGLGRTSTGARRRWLVVLIAAAVDAAQNAVEISRDQFEAGLTGFQNVLDAQRSLLSFQEQLAESDAAVTSDLIRLYKGLGGGWSSAQRSFSWLSPPPVATGRQRQQRRPPAPRHRSMCVPSGRQDTHRGAPELSEDPPAGAACVGRERPAVGLVGSV